MLIGHARVSTIEQVVGLEAQEAPHRVLDFVNTRSPTGRDAADKRKPPPPSGDGGFFYVR